MDDTHIRQDICRIGKLLYDKGMIAGLEGNISCRADREVVLITPAGRCKGFLAPSDVVRIGIDGKKLTNGEPSSEFRLHLAGYQGRSDVNAAVHAHTPHLSAFALKGESLTAAGLVPEFVETFGKIPLVPFARPGTQELGDNLTKVAAHAHTFLLERHGAIAFGTDLWEAFHRMEMAEQLAKTLILAQAIAGGRGGR